MSADIFRDLYRHDQHHRRTRPHPRRQQKLVTTRAMVSARAAVVPIPGADIVADIGLLTKLLPEISKRFGLDHDQVQLEPQLAQQAFVMASSLGNTMIGRMVTKRIVVALLRRMGARIAVGSMAKFIPFAGSAVAATISFGAMKLAGNSHVDDCYKTALALLPADQRALANA
ncbi:hypothetical protein QP162_16270 [Sphingomonas aurantiaca]|uniref:hypothetical protein n=1 Tax=Sphingomonas aurantiaca TaxID=185949 RepID=UPI002FE0A98C